jgi:hypothetical protein
MIGPLQRRILEALAAGPQTVAELALPRNWRRTGPASYGIAAVQGLFRRGYVARELDGRAYRYSLTRKGRAELGLPEPDAPKLDMGGTENAH